MVNPVLKAGFALNIWKEISVEHPDNFLLSCRKSANLWLNDTAVKSIRKVGKVTSLTVSPGVENKLTLQYGGSVRGWTLSTTPGELL